MPLVWTIHVQSQNGNTQIHIKIIPMEQADSACGFRLPGENFWWRKICRLHMALRPFPGLDLPCFRPPIAAMFCRSTPFFSDWTIWQHPSALLSIYSSTFQRSFFLRDFIPEFVLRFSCRQSLLQAQSTLIFQQACRKEVLDTNISPKFGRCMWHHTVGHPQMICCACMGQDEDAFTNLPYHPVADGVLKHARKGLRDHVTKKKKKAGLFTAFRSSWERCHLIQLAVHDWVQMFTANMQIHRCNETSHHETQGLPGGLPKG